MKEITFGQATNLTTNQLDRLNINTIILNGIYKENLG